MNPIFKNPFFIIVSGIMLVVLVGLVMFYFGDSYSLNHLSFRSTTTDQLAQHMRSDDFYSTYRENTLLFSGQVTNINLQGTNETVTLKTTDSYGVSCVLGPSSPQTDVKTGETYQFIAEAYQAVRLTSGVQLTCWQI